MRFGKAVNGSAAVLVDKMKAHNCTNGWDMMCCYDEKHVNDLLKEKYKSGEMIANVHFEIEETIPLIHYHYKVVLDMILDQPRVRFDAADKERCELTMVIGGGTLLVYELNEEGKRVSDEEPEPQDIPADVLQIKGRIPISGVSGDEKSEMYVCYNPSTIINFTDKVREVSIILNFSHEEAQYEVEDVGGGTEKAKELLSQEIVTDLKEFLSKYYTENIESVKYKIGGLSALGEGYCGMYPRSFIFAFSHGEDRNTLNIYAQIADTLEGEGRYHGHKGDLYPSFQPDGKAALPVPDGFSASLILSHELMEQLYFRLEMEDKGWKAESLDNTQVGAGITEGITMSLKPDLGVTEYNGAPQGEGNWNYKMDSGTVDFNTDYIKMTLTNQDTKLDWHYASGKLVFKGSLNMGVFGVQEYNGKIRVSGSCQKTAPMRLVNHETGEIKWEIKLDSSDLHISADITDRDDMSIFGKMSNVPEQFRNKTVRTAQALMPSFHVSMKAINTFLLGSILFPGTHVFRISDADGCYTPRDFIIFGNLEDHLDRLEQENKMKKRLMEIRPEELTRSLMPLLSDPLFAGKYMDAVQDEAAWDQLSQEKHPDIEEGLKRIRPEQEEEVRAVAGALEEGDICWWSGVYKPETPDWMIKTDIVITGANDEIMVKEDTLPLKKENGSYVWEYQSKQFRVKLRKEYSSKGVLKNTWMEGEIGEGENREHLKAKLETGAFRGLSTINGVKEYLSFFGILGSLLTIKGIIELFWKCRKEDSPGASETEARLNELKELELRRLVKDIGVTVETDLKKSEQLIQNNIDSAIGDEVDRKLEALDPSRNIDEKVQALADGMKEYKETVRREIRISAKNPFKQAFKRDAGGFEHILKTRDRVEKEVMDYLAGKIGESIEGDYMKSVIQNRVYEKESAALHNEVNRISLDIDRTNLDISDMEADLQQKINERKALEHDSGEGAAARLEALNTRINEITQEKEAARGRVDDWRGERTHKQNDAEERAERAEREREERERRKRELKF